MKGFCDYSGKPCHTEGLLRKKKTHTSSHTGIEDNLSTSEGNVVLLIDMAKAWPAKGENGPNYSGQELLGQHDAP